MILISTFIKVLDSYENAERTNRTDINMNLYYSQINSCYKLLTMLGVTFTVTMSTSYPFQLVTKQADLDLHRTLIDLFFFYLI